MLNCIDDTMTAELSNTVQVGYRVSFRFAKACGWQIPDSKSPRPVALFRLLGAMVGLRRIPLPPILRLADDRYWQLYGIISDVLCAESLSAGLAGQLFGQ